MSPIRSVFRDLFRGFGYELTPHRRLGTSAYADMKRLCADPRSPIVFDVGANVGQTVEKFQAAFPNPRVYAFEPSADAFEVLTRSHGANPQVRLQPFGLGSRNDRQNIIAYADSRWNSFLAPRGALPTPVEERECELRTLDDFASEQRIEKIDILKIDTQGFELEVLRGAEKYLAEARVGLVYLELLVVEMYDGAPLYEDVCKFLRQSGFDLVAFYRFYTDGERAHWTDALFSCSRRAARPPEASTPSTP